MRKRVEKIFLKVMRNTPMAGVIIILLFAGMGYSLWSLLDGNRVLSKVVLVGTITPAGDSDKGQGLLRGDNGIPVRLTVSDGDILRDNLRPHDEFTILFPVVGSGKAVRATFVGYDQTPLLKKGQGHTFIVHLIPEEGSSGESLSKIFSQGTATSMEISFRTK